MRTLAALALSAVVFVAAAGAGEDPLVLTPCQDTVINPGTLGAPDGWVGKAEDLMIYGPKHANKDYRSLMQFDLKDLPKQPVALAVLKLSVFKMYAVRKTKLDIIRVHRMLRPWGEATASWGQSVPGDEWINKGGDFDPTPVAATPVTDALSGDASGKTFDFDLTPVVQAWQAGQPNFGIILLNVDNDSETTCRPFSRDAKNDADRPKLTLYWAAPPKRNPEWMKPTVLKPVGQPVQMRVALNPSIKQARVGEKYDDFLKGKGGVAPYTFKVQGELPEGLTITPEGLVQGTPTKPGKCSLTISVTDAGHRTGSGKLSMDVVQPDKGPVAAGGKKDGDKPADKGGEKKPDKPKVDEE